MAPGLVGAEVRAEAPNGAGAKRAPAEVALTLEEDGVRRR